MRNQLFRFLFLVITCIPPFTVVAQHSFGIGGISHYVLPGTYKSGLIDVFFKYQPEIRVDQFETMTKIVLDMNVEFSTASDVKGQFFYRYWYDGKQYTDVQLGRDVFLPITAENMALKVWITGPGSYMKTVIWNKFMGGHIVAEIPGKHKATDFKAHFQSLESISFKGTRAMHDAIENLLSFNRKKEAAEKQAGAEKIVAAKKVEKERADLLKKQQEEKAAAAKNPAEKQPTESGNKRDMAADVKKQAGSDDAFWNEKKPGTDDAEKNRPLLAKSTDGKYYQKNAAGKYEQIGYDDYMLLKKQQRDAATEKNEVETAQQLQKDKAATAELMGKIKKDQADQAAAWQEVDRKINLQQQGFAAVAAREDARKDLTANSTLNGNYQSIEQLMAEFDSKMANVNSLVNNLTYQKNNALNRSVDASFNGPGDATYNQSIKLIGTMINQAKEAKERRLAQQELVAQKNALVHQLEQQQAMHLSGIRTDILSKFREGAFPTSASNIAAPEIYYFVYAYDPTQLGSKQPYLFVSNVFSVAQYGDGTWPFKSKYANDITKLTPYGEVMHGYYTELKEAERMQQGLISLFQKTGGIIHPIAFQKKPGKASLKAGLTGNDDFWETGAAGKKKDAVPAKKDDFWNN